MVGACASAACRRARGHSHAFLKVGGRTGSFDRFWALLNRECLPALEAVRGGIVPPEKSSGLSNPFHLRVNITKHQSTLRIMTSTLPYIKIILQ